jgi:4-aminobutyrate aminotransferase-like enzyme
MTCLRSPRTTTRRGFRRHRHRHPYGGHRDDAIVASATEQVANLTHTPCSFTKKAVHVISDMKAVENAVKITPKYIGRNGFAVLEHAYHGRTRLTMTMTVKAMPYPIGFGPFTGGLPLAAVVGRAKIMDAAHPDGLGGTFGGNPVSSAAAIAAAVAAISSYAANNGVLLPTAGAYGSVLRFLPSLAFGNDLLIEAVSVLDEALATL